MEIFSICIYKSNRLYLYSNLALENFYVYIKHQKLTIYYLVVENIFDRVLFFRVFRYKMPRLIAKVEGKGNGIKTVIPNMADIARSLGRPPTCKLEFLASLIKTFHIRSLSFESMLCLCILFEFDLLNCKYCFRV